MTEKSRQSEHFFLVSDLSGFFLLCCTIHFIRTLYVCAAWAIHRLHILMCSPASHLFNLLCKHEAETDKQ